jgi:hypothetical protein
MFGPGERGTYGSGTKRNVSGILYSNLNAALFSKQTFLLTPLRTITSNQICSREFVDEARLPYAPH